LRAQTERLIIEETLADIVNHRTIVPKISIEAVLLTFNLTKLPLYVCNVDENYSKRNKYVDLIKELAWRMAAIILQEQRPISREQKL
jgi:hypothetical protein